MFIRYDKPDFSSKGRGNSSQSPALTTRAKFSRSEGVLQNGQTSPTHLVRRPSRSPASKARIQIKNRRKHYIDTHPEYFSSPSLELSDPLAYDRLIRRFQSASEREAEGRKKGYSGVLEADLWRSEAKVAALANPDEAARMRYRRTADGEIVAEEKDEIPLSKEEGMQRWRGEMEMRFLRGEDAEFEYRDVDESEEFDDWATEGREFEERWFDEDEPAKDEEEAAFLSGETGVQDY